MLSSLLKQFRQQYPQGSLTSDLLTLHDGLYVVRVCVGVDNRILASGLGANTTLEVAEDIATTRALERLSLAVELPSLPFPIEVDRVEAPEPAIAKPSPGLANLEAIAPSDRPNDKPLPTTHPELAPPPLSLVPPALDQGNILEQPTAELPLTAVAAPTPPLQVAPFQADLPATIEAPTDEFVDLGAEPAAVDLSDIIAQTDVELQRLGWGVAQGREFLKKTYGKLSRHDLTDDELLEFLLFLETQSPHGSA
ncbi:MULTISPECIES: hypothetical protein [Cyanophyceae]|uniref:hypothetical protein n=1 Tax=Cyanophyceae TaxID=3028117 RepID=UPI001687B0A2|nr:MULTISPECIES: hypothetical protein [Cyanophyceae]MBD1918790.1 hypothetical protein [Phormidium sp. FACHB-77]MBD2033367.1 hypothetical protein [Phormidium sp. FACHB-322]MBD2053700.1 hypothetical protein [Leptolyngbya sp. FACHB-60]